MINAGVLHSQIMFDGWWMTGGQRQEVYLRVDGDHDRGVVGQLAATGLCVAVHKPIQTAQQLHHAVVCSSCTFISVSLGIGGSNLACLSSSFLSISLNHITIHIISRRLAGWDLSPKR
jgi:hypothetical protein